MITKLTPQQQRQLKIHRQKWFEIGVSTEPANWARAEEAISKMYKTVDKKPPRFVRTASPLEATKLINELKARDSRKSLNKLEYVSTWLWGQIDSYWIAFYLFCRDIGVSYKPEDNEKLDLWADIAQSANWFYAYENVCFICDRPAEIHMNSDEKLHKDGGPAVKFRDGWSIWRLNDVVVSQEIAETPADQLDPQMVLREENAEVRRELVRKIGIERLMEKLPTQLLDQMDDYSLLNVDLGDGRMRPYLKMRNPSIDTFHLEGVDPKCTTVKQALAWRNGTKTYNPPEVLT